MTGVFTNNWAGLKNSMILGGVSQSGQATVYNVSGALVRATSCVSPVAAVAASYTPGGTSNAVRFGTSDTAAAATDIDLGTAWSSGLTYVSVANGDLTWSSSTASRTVTIVVQNTAAASVTIREFGIFCSSSSGAVLLYRGVLDTAVTVAQYESASLTFTVSMTLSNPA